MKFYPWFLFFYLFANSSPAQEVAIKEVIVRNFPQIQIIIETEHKLDFTELSIYQNKQKLDFKVDSLFSVNSGQSVFFVLDMGSAKNYSEKEFILHIINQILTELNPSYYVNFATSFNSNDLCILPLSYEFTQNFNDFADFIKPVLFLKEYQEIKDFDCLIRQSAEFYHSKFRLKGPKDLIYLSYNINNDSNLNSLSKKILNNSGIKLWLISLSNHDSVMIYKIFAPGKPNFAKNQYTLKTLVQRRSYAGLNIAKQYLLEFNSNSRKRINEILIKYKKEKILKHFISPIATHSLPQKLMPYILVFLILIIAILIIVLIKNRNKLVNQKSINEISFTDVESKKMPLIGGGKIVPYITITTGENTRRVDLTKLLITIGRNKDNDIVIDNLTISAHHASISNEGGEFYIQDHESTNGTFVNNLKISKSLIKINDIVRLGNTKLQIYF